VRKAGIVLLVIGPILTVPVPFVMTLLRHRHLERLPHPTPEDLSAGVMSSFIVATAGVVLSWVGLLLVLLSANRAAKP